MLTLPYPKAPAGAVPWLDDLVGRTPASLQFFRVNLARATLSSTICNARPCPLNSARSTRTNAHDTNRIRPIQNKCHPQKPESAETPHQEWTPFSFISCTVNNSHVKPFASRTSRFRWTTPEAASSSGDAPRTVVRKRLLIVRRFQRSRSSASTRLSPGTIDGRRPASAVAHQSGPAASQLPRAATDTSPRYAASQLIGVTLGSIET